MTFGERLKSYREQRGLTQEQLAQMIGVAKSTITGYEKGNREPDVLKIKKIIYSLGISADKLLGMQKNENEILSTHEQQIIKKYRALDDHGKKMINFVLDEEYNNNLKPSQIKKTSELNDEENVIYIDFAEQKASAGNGDFLSEEYLSQIAVIETPLTHKANLCVTVSGDSMEPTYHDNDILLIHKQQTVEHGEIGVFVVDGSAYVKEYGKRGLISHNKNYQLIVPSEYSSCYCIGKVIGILSSDLVK